MARLRCGVREQTELIQMVRKRCRAVAKMKGVTGFSLLSARHPKVRTRKEALGDSLSHDTDQYAKRRKFN